MSTLFKKSLFWFRRDLRIADNAALYSFGTQPFDAERHALNQKVEQSGCSKCDE